MLTTGVFFFGLVLGFLAGFVLAAILSANKN